MNEIEFSEHWEKLRVSSGISVLAEETLLKLEGGLREVFVLRYLENLHWDDIAEILQIRRSTVFHRLKRARELFLAAYPRTSPEVVYVVELIKELTPGLIRHLQRFQGDIDKIPAHIFEHLIGEFLAQRGLDYVKLVGRETSTSADILAIKNIPELKTEMRFFVEVKRWKSRIGIQVINEVYGAMLLERPKLGWNAAMIVSLAGFSTPRKLEITSLANLNILLKDRAEVLEWLRDYEPSYSGLWLPASRASGMVLQ